jgi:single-stranded DNA-binding protein
VQTGGKGGAIIAGRATKDAEVKQIGEKHTTVVNFGVAVGKDSFVNCKVFGTNLTGIASNIKKGDSLCAAGAIEEREYNGKIYKTLNIEWLNVIGIHAAATQAQEDAPQFRELSDEDDGLPF